MAKELYVYTTIFDFIAEMFIANMEEAQGEHATVRINSDGGGVRPAWGMIAKSREHKGGLSVKVDGHASSMMAFYLLYFRDVEALDVSDFLMHRAHFQHPADADEDDQRELDEMNASFRKAMEAKLNIPKFEKLAGVSLDEFFEGDKVINVRFNAKSAKKIGLIKKITNLAPEEINALGLKFAAYTGKTSDPTPPKNETMTLKELKEKHPELYKEAIAKGTTEAIAKAKSEADTAGNSGSTTEEVVAEERDRVGAWMAFNEIDPKAVTEGIKSGKSLSQTAIAEFSMKMLSKSALAKVEGDNADDTETNEGSELDQANKAFSEAVESGDKEKIIEAQAAVLAASGKENSPQAEDITAFEAEARKGLKLDTAK